jgi:hypothetical protein
MTLYAGTSLAGVFRSLDGGSSWTPMNDGLLDDETFRNSGLFIHSLVLDPADGVLRAGTENGVFAIRRPLRPRHAHRRRITYASSVGVTGRRSMAQIPDWRRDFRVARGSVVEQADRFGSFSLPNVTGDSELPEVVVKMVDPHGGHGVWLFHGSLTGLPYILTVTDTATGRVETYTNDPENRLCGVVDDPRSSTSPPARGTYLESPDPGAPESAASLAKAENGALSLLGGSILVHAFGLQRPPRSKRAGRRGRENDRYGYFSLPGFTGDPLFPEIYVKMVDFRAISGGFLLIFSGLTSLDYTLTVTDSVTRSRPGLTRGPASSAAARSGSPPGTDLLSARHRARRVVISRLQKRSASFLPGLHQESFGDLDFRLPLRRKERTAFTRQTISHCRIVRQLGEAAGLSYDTLRKV